MGTIIGIFILLHGLVHIWYVALSLRIVPFQPEMGYSGESWLWTKLIGDKPTRVLAAIGYACSAVGLVLAGIGGVLDQTWAQTSLTVAATISALTIVMFWDGKTSKLIEKGLLGFVISVLLLLASLIL